MGDHDKFAGGLNPASVALVKPCVFISYHHGGDQSFYDCIAEMLSGTVRLFHNASVERETQGDDVDYVRWKAREVYIRVTSCTIVLCGLAMPYRKYVDWEIKATLDMGHGLIGINLPTNFPDPGSRKYNVPDRLYDNIQSGYAIWAPNWNSINAESLTQHITRARLRAKNSRSLINNRRDPKARNW